MRNLAVSLLAIALSACSTAKDAATAPPPPSLKADMATLSKSRPKSAGAPGAQGAGTLRALQDAHLNCLFDAAETQARRSGDRKDAVRAAIGACRAEEDAVLDATAAHPAAPSEPREQQRAALQAAMETVISGYLTDIGTPSRSSRAVGSREATTFA